MFVHIINMSEYALVTQTYRQFLRSYSYVIACHLMNTEMFMTETLRQFLRSYSYVIACHLMNTEMFMTETLKSKSCHINQN